MGGFGNIDLDELVLTGDGLSLRAWRLDGAGTGLECAIAADATAVGRASLQLSADDPAEGGIEITVDPAARRRGYATQAVRLLAGFAFGHGVRRVRIGCGVGEVAWARTALAAGFGFEGVRRGTTGPAGGPDGRQDRAEFARLDTDPDVRQRPAFAPLPGGGLEDGVIRLRPTTPEDTDAFVEQEQDALTVRNGFAGTAPPPARVAAMTRGAALEWVVGPAAPMTIVDVASGRFAGAVRLRKPGPPGVGSIGYVVHPAFRGRGYATRALRLIVAWAFDAGFARLELGVKIDNPASLRVAERAGFVREGVRAARLLSPDGTYVDEVSFALTASATRSP